MQQDSNIPAIPVIAIFDIGKTNKKLLLFNRQYQLVLEESSQFAEITDEDGFPCEDLQQLTNWVKEKLNALLLDQQYAIKAVNFSAYGASFVYLNQQGDVELPLYNYLKPYSEQTLQLFHQHYGDAGSIAKETASPNLGNLNSGMQVYRIKHEKPKQFQEIKHALHLPQYLSYILSSQLYTDITSIGCHTQLWNFQQKKYHEWVTKEGINHLFAPIAAYDHIAAKLNDSMVIGIGLHDSSAALIPYLVAFTEPFVLLSTGTWCISLHPFNQSPLSFEELAQDCLCYLSFQGNPVKASRLFAGNDHEQQVKILADHFALPIDYYKTVVCNPQLFNDANADQEDSSISDRLSTIDGASQEDDNTSGAMVNQSEFGKRSLNSFSNYETAYHQLMYDIVVQQVISTNLVLKDTKVKRIFVDGGFSKNPLYMYLLAKSYPNLEVFAASVPQASAIGAALAIHQHWNPLPLPADMIDLRLYAIHPGLTLGL